MTEAVDNVGLIRRILGDTDASGGRHVYVHMDAALTGITLALHDEWRPLVTGPDAPDSIATSRGTSSSAFPRHAQCCLRTAPMFDDEQ